jgi:hypothetical protein
MLPPRQSKSHEIRVQLKSPSNIRLQPHQVFRGEWRPVLDYLVADFEGTSIVPDGNGLPELFVSGIDELDIQTVVDRVVNYMQFLLGRPKQISEAVIVDCDARWVPVTNAQTVFSRLQRSEDSANFIDAGSIALCQLAAPEVNENNDSIGTPCGGGGDDGGGGGGQQSLLPAFTFADGIESVVDQLNRLKTTAPPGCDFDNQQLCRVLDSLRKFPGDIRASLKYDRTVI